MIPSKPVTSTQINYTNTKNLMNVSLICPTQTELDKVPFDIHIL